MTKKGKSTPPQREETEKGFSLPLLFIAFIVIATLAIIFGPPLMAGIGESSTADTTNSGGSGTDGADGAGGDSSDEIGYPNVYYLVGEIPDEIYIGNMGTKILTLEDFEIEDELIRFTIVHHRGRTNGLDIEVEYLNCEDRSFFKTYRVDIEKLEENEERKQEFGQILVNSRNLNNDEPATIKGVTIKYKHA